MGIKKRGDIYHCRLKVNRKEYIASCHTGSKMHAQALNHQIQTAIRQQNPDVLDDSGRDLARRLFNSDVNIIIPGFHKIEEEIKQEQVQGITLFEGCELLYSDPDVKAKDLHQDVGRNATTYRNRLKQCFEHLMEHLGADDPVLSIHIKDIKKYRLTRLNEGAAPGTINKEVGILSRVFGILIEHGLCENNPCKNIKPLSTKDSVRQVYVGYQDFLKILEHLPDWYKPLALLGYYAAMRAGEIRSLRRDRIDLKRRIIVLVETGRIKERDRKLIPIHLDIVEPLKQHLSGQVVGLNRAFLRDGRAIEKDDYKRPWESALKKAGLSEDINFHDLRHSWRRNARKSGLDPDIRKAIMGHAGRKRDVDSAYDLFDEEDFLNEIDKFRVDFGETRVWVTHREKKQRTKKEKTSQGQAERSISTGGSKVDHSKLKAKHYIQKV